MMVAQSNNTAASAAAAAAQQQYLLASVQSASKEQLLLMLFDGAIRFLKVARKAMDANDSKSSHEHLLKTQKILTELMATLDTKAGGEPAQNLMALYEYYYYRLVQANLKKDTVMVDEVTEHLVNWRNTWDEAIKISHGHQPTSADTTVLRGLDKSKVSLDEGSTGSASHTSTGIAPSRTYQA